MQFKSFKEDQLEGKSGASSHGNSSSNSYIKVVAVKKLVVGFWNEPVGPLQGELLTGLFFFAKTACAL